MNKTEKILILVAALCSFIDVGLNIYDIVTFFLTKPEARPAVFYVVFSFIDIVASVAVAVLLIMSIWKNGTLFRSRYGLYVTALVISIIMNLISITTILLVITIFLSDWEWIKPKDEPIIKGSQREKEMQIAKLRERHNSGELSDEEFQEELAKLL